MAVGVVLRSGGQRLALPYEGGDDVEAGDARGFNAVTANGFGLVFEVGDVGGVKAEDLHDEVFLRDFENAAAGLGVGVGGVLGNGGELEKLRMGESDTWRRSSG